MTDPTRHDDPGPEPGPAAKTPPGTRHAAIRRELVREFGAVSDDDPLLSFMRVCDRLFGAYVDRMEALADRADKEAEARRRHDRAISWLFAVLLIAQLVQALLVARLLLFP